MLPNSTASDCLFQPLWDYLLSRHYTLVSSPFFPVLLACSSYFIFSVPFAILDVLGERAPLFVYKIQKQRRLPVGMMLRTLGTTVYNHLVFVLPGCVDNQCGDACASTSSTCSNRELISSALGVLLMFDTQYYFWHTKTLTCTDESTPSIMITSHCSLGLPSNSTLWSWWRWASEATSIPSSDHMDSLCFQHLDVCGRPYRLWPALFAWPPGSFWASWRSDGPWYTSPETQQQLCTFL